DTMIVLLSFFFFSSRRRHTRLQGDWSSDVCSSDLDRTAIDALIAAGAKGIILDDSGPGFTAAIRAGRAKGVVFVQSDRKGSGRRSEERRVGKEGRWRWSAYHRREKRVKVRGSER